jgi:hypothetical protein
MVVQLIACRQTKVRRERETGVSRSRHPPFQATRRAEKRGGEIRIEQLEEGAYVAAGRAAEMIALDDALTSRAVVQHPRQAEVVELRYFGGLSVEETAVGDGQTTIFLDPGEVRRIPVKVLPPPDALPGQSYSLRVSAKTNLSLQNPAAEAGGRAAAPHTVVGTVAGVVLSARAVLESTLVVTAKNAGAGQIFVTGKSAASAAGVCDYSISVPSMASCRNRWWRRWTAMGSSVICFPRQPPVTG